jgi:glycerol uptake facilitator-like aquaporin
MRRTYWGRPTWLWVVELATAACFIALFAATDRPTTKFIAAAYLVTRVVFTGIQVAMWQRRRAAVNDARDDGALPPR